MNNESIIYVKAEEMHIVFCQILERCGLRNNHALQCAEVFTSNSIDGVYTHGVNRFPVFIQAILTGLIDVSASPSLLSAFGGMEQWNGNLAPGPLNAIHATGRAIELAKQAGIGCVAIANTNHWMRGGYYGWQAARKKKILIAWTNTIANMPAWNATDRRLGNNPLVLALPFEKEAIVLDMAMSQFSFGAMEMAAMKNEQLPVIGGYDEEGNLTNDASAIIDTGRALSIGYWKGAGLALLLDLLATVFSGGLSTGEITKQGNEAGLSQVFISIDPDKLYNRSLIAQTVKNIIDNYKNSAVIEGKKILYPGQKVLQTRNENLVKGIPVLKKVWEKILRL